MLVHILKHFSAKTFFQTCPKPCSFCLRKFSTQENKTKPIPKCVYILPPLQWLKNKINFQKLKSIDKSFDEQQFKIGAKRAVLVILELARSRDSALLAKVSTLRGFSRIYRDMIASEHDPRRRLLQFNSQDIQKVIPTDIHIVQSENDQLCLIEVFFVGLKYLDDVISFYEKHEPNRSLEIYQDIKRTEKMLKNKNYTDDMLVPATDKLMIAEGYLHLFSNVSSSGKESEWKVDFFKISEFNIVLNGLNSK